MHHGGASRLDLLKALGDNTRYAIYLELARSPAPRSTAEVAESLDLHPNTVRPHLERMRDVGLLAVETDGRGGVGRPQHLYSVAADAPSLGLEPPPMPLLARMLAGLAASVGAAGEEAAEIGREQGRAAALAAGTELSATEISGTGMAGTGMAGTGMAGTGMAGNEMSVCVEALAAELARLGFDPALAGDSDAVSVVFTHCPFGELASAHPEIICHLHRGMVEGFVEALGGAGVERFRTLVDRQPCRVQLSRA